MKRVIVVLFLIALAGPLGVSLFAQKVEQIEKTQSDIEIEKALRERLEQEEKIYAEKIEVEGAKLVEKSQIEEITAPFQKHWLTKANIGQLFDLFRDAYKLKGYNLQADKFSYSFQQKDSKLVIKIKEPPAK